MTHNVAVLTRLAEAIATETWAVVPDGRLAGYCGVPNVIRAWWVYQAYVGLGWEWHDPIPVDPHTLPTMEDCGQSTTERQYVTPPHVLDAVCGAGGFVAGAFDDVIGMPPYRDQEGDAMEDADDVAHGKGWAYGG